MTTQALNDFGNALFADKDMAAGLAAAVAEKQGPEGAEAFASYAREKGFDVTRADAEALQRAMTRNEGELSDEQLDGVAGGNVFQDFWHVVCKTTDAVFQRD